MQELQQLGVSPEDILALEQIGALAPQEAIDFIKQKLNEAKRPARLLMRAERFIKNHYSIRLNIISNQIEAIHTIPYTYEYYDADGSICTTESTPTTEWSECKAETIERSLTLNHIAVGSGKVKSLLRSDFIEEYNPIADYFKNLTYKPTKTNPFDELCTYLSVEDFENFKIQFKKQLLRTVKCALDKHYFNKHMFILMSDEQNPGKSSFLRWLCPPTLRNYYAEDPPLDKDGLIAIASNFIINFDELSYLYKKDENLIKGWMSKEYVQVRRPYAATVENIPRIASFFGSTNVDDFLKDATGNVRYICFRLKKPNGNTPVIKWSYKTDIDINQLWAYIYQCLKNGEEYNLSAAEIEENENRNAGFSYVSPEMELIGKYFKIPEPSDINSEFLMASEILQLIQNETGNRTINHRTLGTALKSLGFTKSYAYTVKGSTKKSLPGYTVIRLNNIGVNKQPEQPGIQTTNVPF